MTLINKEQLLDAVMKKSYSQASIQLINDQPEVEAIPISWLQKNYLGELRIAGCKPMYETISEVIEHWRKENENKN